MAGRGADRNGRQKKLTRAVKALLWTGGGDAPDEYIDYVLIRELYHCLPSDLDREDARTIELHRAFMAAEIEDRELKQGTRRTIGKRRRHGKLKRH